MSVYALLLVKVRMWHGWGHCQGTQGPVSPCLMLSPAWVMPHPHPRCPSPGRSWKKRGMDEGWSHPPHAGPAGQVLDSPRRPSCLLPLAAQLRLLTPVPGSSPTFSIRAPPKAPGPPRAPHLLQLNPQGGPRLRAARGWVSETGSTPLPGPVAPTAPGLTPQQEVAAGEEQQRDALGQGAEEATDPAAHNEDEAQGQDHQDGSVQRCQERGFRDQGGTQTGPPREGQQSTSELCVPGCPPL